jgi:hypothetical protein
MAGPLQCGDRPIVRARTRTSRLRRAQPPTPRSGNTFKREYWQDYDIPRDGPRKGKYPDMDFVLVSVDTAFTEKEENDPTG